MQIKVKRGWELPETHVWQPPRAWRAARLHRARYDQEHHESTSDLKEQ